MKDYKERLKALADKALSATSQAWQSTKDAYARLEIMRPVRDRLPVKYKPIASQRFWQITFWNFTLEGMSYNAGEYLPERVTQAMDKVAGYIIFTVNLCLFLPVWLPLSIYGCVKKTKRRWQFIAEQIEKYETKVKK